MKWNKEIRKDVQVIKITVNEAGKEVGRVFIYLLKNDLHKRPFALMEDVFVEYQYRHQGLGSKLITLALAEARKRRCYKIIATSRNSRPGLHKYYEKFGFKIHGVELRKDFR